MTSVHDEFGHTLTLDQVCRVLSISRTTAKRRLDDGTFPVRPLPRRFHQPYRFVALQVDRFLSRATDDVRRTA